MILLDTNVLSELMREKPAPAVFAWLNGLRRDEIWTTTISVFEIRLGLERMGAGRRRQALEEAFRDLLEDGLRGRVAVFDRGAAEQAGRLSARRAAAGRAAEIRDTMMAGIVLAQRATLATRNVRHFDDLGAVVVDPWAG